MSEINDTPTIYHTQAQACPLSIGMPRHLKPAGNKLAIVTKTSSDELFGSNGLGLGNTFWTTIISWLARNGIQEQTRSQPDETSIENCVLGWGQGPYSSRVFSAHNGIDIEQLRRLLSHLDALATDLDSQNHRITTSVLACFVESQTPKPYSSWNGIREAVGFKAKAGSRFRGHIQWQGLIVLCGQVDRDGILHISPELLQAFFTAEEPFFGMIQAHRKALRENQIQPGEPSPLLSNAPEYVDREATDLRYKKNKSGLWILLRIIAYMFIRRQSQQGGL